MLRLQRSTGKNDDFIALVKKLDAYLATTDGDEHAFYDQFNGIEQLNTVVIAYENNTPVACGAFKTKNNGRAEVKRMYCEPNYRNRGYAGLVLNELERWAEESDYQTIILETGARQIEAVQFYEKNGYRRVPNYPPYEGMKNSHCYEKNIQWLQL